MIEPHVKIIVLLYNSERHVRQCLESLAGTAYKNSETIVVDNGSSDRCLKITEKEFPQIRTIRNRKNLGYARGNNAGIKEALKDSITEFVYIVNPDTTNDKNCLSTLVREARKEKKCGIIGPVICAPDGSVQFAGAEINPRTNEIIILKKKTAKNRQSLYAMGCAILIKRAVFEKIGLFDPEYFCYWEETDFCYRAKKAGFKTIIIPAAGVKHEDAETKKTWQRLKMQYYLSKNRFVFAKKNLMMPKQKWFAVAFLKRTAGHAILWSLRSCDIANILGTLAGTAKGIIYFYKN